MIARCIQVLFLVVLSIQLSVAQSMEQHQKNEQQIMVAMRMVGHQMLLLSGDSTSRVLPVQKEGERYKIPFASAFQFYPEELVVTIDSVLKKAQLNTGYLVEMEHCNTKEIIYSYKIGASDKEDMVPCQTRNQPKACYTLFITLLPSATSTALFNPFSPNQNGQLHLPEQPTSLGNTWLMLPLLLIVLLTLLFWKKKQKPASPSSLIAIGAYRFDPKNMELSLGETTTELTGKEADLLSLLYSAVNTPIERETILKKVWGDDGDYIGRTLDVFISKLRKKLEADPYVKIVNIRGVGYKLIVNDD